MRSAINSCSMIVSVIFIFMNPGLALAQSAAPSQPVQALICVDEVASASPVSPCTTDPENGLPMQPALLPTYPLDEEGANAVALEETAVTAPDYAYAFGFAMSFVLFSYWFGVGIGAMVRTVKFLYRP